MVAPFPYWIGISPFIHDFEKIGNSNNEKYSIRP